MILEGIVTTEREDGSMHVAPMGPWVQPDLSDWILKPFQSSTTFANLFRSNRCIFHVVDDAELLAKSVLGIANDVAATWIPDQGYCLVDSCHWYALKIEQWDLSDPRAMANASIQGRGIQRPFFGWNRAKHAVLEAAILASRLRILSQVDIRKEMERLKIAIEKTAGPQEKSAFAMLEEHMEQHWKSS